MTLEAGQIIKRFEAAASERLKHEPIFDEAIRLTMPNRTRFTKTTINDTADDIFDETGVNATAEFVSRMQAGLFPSFTDFLSFEAGESVAEKDRRAVNKDLDDIQKFFFEEVWASNFALQAPETLNDLAISTGLMNVEESRGESSFKNRAIPITNFFLERASDDSLGGILRSRIDVPMNEIEDIYGPIRKEATTSRRNRNSEKKVDVIEYTRRIPNAAIETSWHYVVIKSNKEIIKQKKLVGVGSNPMIPYRWSTASGETWGRGPVLSAMGGIRTTNLAVELILENAAMSIVGIYQSDNDATINADTVQLLPGTILPHEVGTEGLRQVQTATGNFNMQNILLTDQRTNIKKALFNDMLSDPNRTPATATEVVERMSDLAYRTAAGFSRVFYEMLVPYARRGLYILEKQKKIELPVQNGRPIKFRAVGPLARAQMGRDLQTLMQDFSMRANIFGPQVAAATYEIEALHPWLIKRTGLDEHLFKDAKGILESIENAAKQMAELQAQSAQPPQ